MDRGWILADGDTLRLNLLVEVVSQYQMVESRDLRAC